MNHTRTASRCTQRIAHNTSGVRLIVLAAVIILASVLVLATVKSHQAQVAAISESAVDKWRHGYLQILARRGYCELQQPFSSGGSGSKYRCEIAQAISEYGAWEVTYTRNIQKYTVFGDWLNYGVAGGVEPSRRVRFDSTGVPMELQWGKFYYNPVSVSLHALSMHGKYVRGDDTAREKFIRDADALLRMQDASGAFRYLFPWKYYINGQTFRPGWVSGMAQGIALSVFARAYHLTNEVRYLAAGDRAFDFLITPVSAGGVMDTLTDLDPSLSDKVIFEEYVAKPSTYTLNGFMYAMLGVYDWSRVSRERSQIARKYFLRAVDTLHFILPWYDLGGFTAYDLGYVVYHRRPHIGASYHAVHVFLLHALSSITDDPELAEFERLWASYVPR